MADPLSIAASVLAVVTATIQSSKSLYETVKRFKDRNKTLRRLQDELEDLGNILSSLKEAVNAEVSVLALLRGPLDRCSQVCREFEQTMQVFTQKSKPGFLDWTKMEFMRGDINEFIDTISGYKSTISVGLGTITMHTSKVSQQVLEQYNEMIQDTAYNLELHLQRIDEKMAQFTTENTNCSDVSIDLKDERAVTEQCIRICEDARSCLDSLKVRESTLLNEASRSVIENGSGDCFEAQLVTYQALDDNRDRFAAISNRLRERLETLILDGTPGKSEERQQLQEDINISKQCLEVCKVAKEVSHQKIYRIGEVVADGDSDQVVVTTLADLFDVKKALSKGNSAQLIGSMTDETLRHMTEKRYGSRFGAVPTVLNHPASGTTDTSSVSEPLDARRHFQSTKEQFAGLETERHSSRPSPNEMRKRLVSDGNGLRNTSTNE